jgi:hypothetical protein
MCFAVCLRTMSFVRIWLTECLGGSAESTAHRLEKQHAPAATFLADDDEDLHSGLNTNAHSKDRWTVATDSE